MEVGKPQIPIISLVSFDNCIIVINTEDRVSIIWGLTCINKVWGTEVSVSNARDCLVYKHSDLLQLCHHHCTDHDRELSNVLKANFLLCWTNLHDMKTQGLPMHQNKVQQRGKLQRHVFSFIRMYFSSIQLLTNPHKMTQNLCPKIIGKVNTPFR